ncbi:MAG TPA: protein kinase [Dehalococcoidia bacterium]|nr:protein kinase [Dehalococcoidia bacterium]
MLPFDELVLNKYRILRSEGRRDGLLGRGTFGSVYKAHEELADRFVAIKELGLDSADLETQQEEALRRFLTEGRLGLRVRHPNILEVHAIEPYEEGYLLVMELAESGDLKGFLQRGRPPLQQAITIATGIARGLQAAHERGIVHRDLKPGNVFLMEDGTPKVADFGVAHIPQAVGGYLSMTRTGFQPGTVIYMSPEQASGRRIDHRSDLYSLAVIFFELLTGTFYVNIQKCRELAQSRAESTPVLEELRFFQVFSEVAFEGEIPRPSTRNPAIPAWLDELVLRGLARNPDDRFQSGREFAEVLQQGELSAASAAAYPPLDATIIEPLTPASLGRPQAEPEALTPAPPADATIVEERTPGPATPPAPPEPTLYEPRTPAPPEPTLYEPRTPPPPEPTLPEVRTPAPPEPTLAEPLTPSRPFAPAADTTVVDLPAPADATPGIRPAARDAGVIEGIAESEEARYVRPPVSPPAVDDHEQQTVYVPLPRRDEPRRSADGAAAAGAGGGAALAGAGGAAGRGGAVGGRTAPEPATGGGIKRLWPLALAAVLLVAAGVGIRFAVAGGKSSPRPTPTTTAANVTASATAAVSSTPNPTASPSPSPTASPTPAPTVTPADKLDVATLLRPNATRLQSFVVAGKNAGDPGQLVLQSQAPDSSGCQRPYIDVYRPDKSGKWASVWDATQQPSAEKALLPAVKKSGDQCFPNVEALLVQPLIDNGPPHGLASIILDEKGTRRLVAFSFDDAAKPVALDFDLQTTPGATVELTDGKPQGVHIIENAYASGDSGVNGGYDQPIGKFDEILTWDAGARTFKQGHHSLALNCTSGKITALGGSALQAQCADGSYTAVAVGGSTKYDANVAFADLKAGDDVTFAVDEATLAPADPLNALPTAASLSDAAAKARKAPPPSTTGRPATTGTTGVPSSSGTSGTTGRPATTGTTGVPSTSGATGTSGSTGVPSTSGTGGTTGGSTGGFSTGGSTTGGTNGGFSTGGGTTGGTNGGFSTGR